jgi:hypothetical protein
MRRITGPDKSSRIALRSTRVFLQMQTTMVFAIITKDPAYITGAAAEWVHPRHRLRHRDTGEGWLRAREEDLLLPVTAEAAEWVPDRDEVRLREEGSSSTRTKTGSAIPMKMPSMQNDAPNPENAY